MNKGRTSSGKKKGNSIDAGVFQQASNKSDDEEKLLNTGSSMEMFLNVCDVFEKLLDEIEIDSCCKQVKDKLYSVQEAIQQKVEPFRLPNYGSEYGDLTSCRSLGSSMQSLYSVTSEAALGVEDDLAFKQFLIKVNCPFCSKSQTDKINLIGHLSNCKPFILKTFAEQKFMPYSVFQILPNNSFKCNICPNSVQKNLKRNFVHAKKNDHILAYKRLAVKKTFTEFFFCSSCKTLVPDNFTQIDIHVNSKIHSSKCLKNIKVDTYLKKNIHCLYMRSKKFKCLICLLHSLFSTPAEIIKHFDDTRHIKALRQKHLSLGVIFCEFCSMDVHSYELISHFTSIEHKLQEKIQSSEETFELCLYCGVLCKNLMELAEHMKDNCREINKLRKENPELDVVNKIPNTQLKKLDDVTKQKSNNDKKIPGGTKKRNIIIIMNNTEIAVLYGYFRVFGEIIAVELFEEKNVLIEFKEKSAVDEVLRFRDIIKINDLKIEITTELKSEKKAEPKKDGSQRRVSFMNPSYSDLETERENEKEDNRDGDDPVNDILNLDLQNDQFRELFERVSDHLINSTQKFNSDVQKTILQDCGVNIDGLEVTLVGFAGSGLSFSVESVSLYLISNSVFEHELFSLCSILLDELKWKDVTYYELEPVPYVKAIHKATETVCKITIGKSAKILTDILCYYQKENNIVKPFCLMIRFWLDIHELKIREYEYVIMSLLIFFLVNEKVVKPFPKIDTQVSMKAFVFEELLNEKYKLNEETTKNEDKKTYGLHELFLKFLLFLIKFDFDKHAICVPVKHPILRDGMQQKQFIGIHGINDGNNSPMFIWDPLVQVNLAQSISENDLKSLLDTVSDTIFR